MEALSRQLWCVPREWPGETVFVVAGGPSVSSVDLDRLRGRRVVVVNSSFVAAPWADVLVFTDRRWWMEYRRRVRALFGGRVVTLTPMNETYSGLLVLERQRSGGLSMDPTRLAWWHTSMTSAINLVALMGAARIPVLGLDGAGGWHHAPHPERWGSNPKKFEAHGEALRALAEPLATMGVQVVNLNPASAHRMFPFSNLDEELTA